VESGVKVFIMAGNRDFLLGERFALETTTTLIQDPLVIDLYGRQTLLTHGDRLNIGRDTLHSLFHDFMDNKKVQKLFFMLPVFVRKTLAWGVHGFSCVRGFFVSRKHMKDIVLQDAMAAMLQQDVNQIIHGHIHLPFIDEQTIDNENFRHIVLEEWKDVGSALVYQPYGQCDFIWFD
jgi:UDP-2,3-diacylglucosamine hydrolase